jgi:DNA-binding transcriptional regulator GbsR (MarR family)
MAKLKYEDCKEKYLETWGTLATQWGINRTMAQIHALILISPELLSAEDIMEELQISRGNANMNIRALMEWGLVEKKILKGERKEFFYSKKDIWELFKQITKERRKRELDPVIEMLSTFKSLEAKTEEEKEFVKVTSDIARVSKKLNNILDLAIQSDELWIMNKIKNLF